MNATNLIVKDYPFKDQFIFGTFYTMNGGQPSYILDDGDVYTDEEELKASGYEYIFIHSNDIIEVFKKRFNRDGVA